MKEAKVISRIKRDATNNKVVHIATPDLDKNRDDVPGSDYTIQTINLGPTSMEQEIEEYEGSNAVILGRLRKEVQTKQGLKRENEKLKKYFQNLMKPLQSINSSSFVASLLPQETIIELERMKATTHATMSWLQGVQVRGDNSIKELLSTSGDVMRSIDWLKNVVAQDKEDVDILLQKTKTIMEYTKNKFVSDGILPSSRVVEPWEWF